MSMTQKEKAIAYDEAIERAKNIYKDTWNSYILKIFPELQESNDGMTQKDIINTIEKNIENIINDKKYAPDAKDFIIKEMEEQIAWFKKHGKQKDINPTLLEKEKMDNAFTQMMFKGKTALEAKFHKGDWIANNNSGAVCQVIEIRDDEYCLWPLDAEMMGYLRIIDVDNDYHLWTIEDAKEGDILVNKAYDAVLIFKSIRNNYLFSSYCDYFVNTFRAKQFSQWASSAFIPATKKQRDFLFAKMREAGYEWNDDKKELRMILQIPTDKVYPKFHEGDWIIYRDEGCTEILRISGITDTHYICIDISDDYCRNLNINFIDSHNYHLWTIRDVKDGDVLAWNNSKCIAIFKNIYDEESFNSYGCVGHCTGTFEVCLSYHDIEGVHPATKKQRDLLFEKMKEAGYEWDSEEKTLRKIIQNPTDKIEAKFQEGNWIVNNDTKDVFLIKSINNGYCTLEDIKGNIISPCLPPCESESHIWTIQDAKAGDVLFNGIYILLFKEINKWHNITTYLAYSQFYGIREHFISGSDIITPATKEQRDTLFAKMKDAGYEWNSNKKELKKFHIIDEGKDEMDHCFTKMMNDEKVSSAWSEEDEKMVKDIIAAIDTLYYHGMVNWLKSLKDRVQPQNKWKPSKEQIIALRWVLNNIPYNKHKEEISGLLDQIKDLHLIGDIEED